MQKSVLVTGGAGFIGSHLVDALVNSGYHVVVLDNLSTGNLENLNPINLDSGSVKFVNGDIRDKTLVSKIIEEVDRVVHLAAQTSVTYSIKNPQFNDEVNVVGTSNLLTASCDADIEKFVFISSCSVYGEPIYLPVNEQHPTQPISPYASSKLASEKEILNLHKQKNLNCGIVRFFNVYGPRQGLNDYSGVIVKFIDNIKQQLPLQIYGDGSQTRDFIYVKDAVNAIMLILEQPKSNGQIFNIGTGKATTIKELAEKISQINSVKPNISYAPARDGDIKYSYADISKAKTTLGYKPQYGISEGLTELIKTNRDK
jgi:UDP-glucose 4-epimerase